MSEGGPGAHLLTERDGHVLVVTMNRPDRRNALSLEMMEGMSAAWDEANADPDVRAKRERMRSELTAFVDSQPDEIAQLVQSWLAERKS